MELGAWKSYKIGPSIVAPNFVPWIDCQDQDPRSKVENIDLIKNYSIYSRICRLAYKENWNYLFKNMTKIEYFLKYIFTV
jgi:hypothetical protein